MTSGHQMETFQGKILEVMDPLSRLWKGLEYIHKAPSDQTVEVPVEKFVALVEQVIFLLLGQTSLSVSYTRRLNILKLITKDPRKAKAILKENENIFKENETHLFRKKFRSQRIETEKSRKKSLEVFKDFGEKKSPFRKDLSRSQNKPHGGERYYYAGKPGNRDQHKHRKFQSPFQHNSARKFQHRSSKTLGKCLFQKSKGGSFHQQLETSTTDINDFDTSSSKKIIYRRNTKCITGRKAITVCKIVGKNYA